MANKSNSVTYGSPSSRLTLMLSRNVSLIATVVLLLVIIISGGLFFSQSSHYVDRSSTYNVKVFSSSLSNSELEALPPTSFSYLAMIDAGSSGCRVHVYRYGKLDKESGPLFVLPQHTSKKVKPGLSSFAKNPDGAGPSLEGLITFLKEAIPESSWPHTPIWLKATAGLRMLPEAESAAILGSVRSFLRDPARSPFIFRPSYARIISGKEEGSFGWIAFNYLKKLIGPKAAGSEGGLAPPFAVVEMGGASSQVTQRVPPQYSQRLPEDNHMAVQIENQRFDLYTYSYLGYGAEQAREKLNAFLLSADQADYAPGRGQDGAALQDPCLNKGYVREKGAARDSVYDGPETALFSVHGAAGGPLPGAGNTNDMCFDIMRKFFSNEIPGAGLLPALAQPCNHKNHGVNTPHSFGCVHQPSFVQESLNFLVFENFFYSSSAANVLPAGHPAGELSSTAKAAPAFPLVTSPLELKEAAEEVCRLSNEELHARYPRDGQPKDVATKLCFSLSYSAAFLLEGLHLAADKAITVQKEVDGDEIEWALGAAYKEAAEFLKISYLKPT
jgi:hypothetical protein